MLGIKHIILAINKFDLINYDKKVYDNIQMSFKSIYDFLSFETLQIIPISALNGDNVITKSNKMNWYKGPSLLKYLEGFKSENKSNNFLRVPIQYVIRKGQDFRGYAGTIVSGKIKRNQSVKVLPSGFETKVETIFDFNKKLSSAESGKSITFTLKDQLDVSRGDILVEKSQPCEIANQFSDLMDGY